MTRAASARARKPTLVAIAAAFSIAALTLTLAPPATHAAPPGEVKPTKKPRPARTTERRITRTQAAAARRWVGFVRHRLFRAWIVPKELPVKARERLSADVEIAFDPRGRIEKWTLAKPAAGEGADAFNRSLETVGRRVRSIPRPNAGALALFVKRRLVLRFKASSPLLKAL